MALTPSTLITTLRDILVTYKGTLGDGMSVADISKIARIEPITLISSNLSGVKELYFILHGILNIYAAYYLQAISILSTQLNDVRILKILDKTNPDRDLKTLLTSGHIAYEQMSHTTASIETLSLANSKFKLPSAKATKPAFESLFEDTSNEPPLSSSIQRLDTFEKLGVAIGKVLELRFSVKPETGSDNTEVSLPVVVKLDNMIIPSDVITNITVSNKDEITLGSRFKDAITGRISFIKDFILASDLIKAQKKSMIKDPTGYYSQMLKRLNNSKLYSALSGNISLAGVSSIVIISEEEEDAIQRQIGGKLSNATTRKIVFDNISAMMIVVVDKSWERVSIYVKDIDGFSQSSFDSFKPMASKEGAMIQDLLKAFTLNSPPSF